nr:MAG TPA: hypothetical protein [Crassvirales sp.]
MLEKVVGFLFVLYFKLILNLILHKLFEEYYIVIF